MQKVKVKDQSIRKIEWKWTDGRTDGRYCITCCANAVGKCHCTLPPNRAWLAPAALMFCSLSHLPF